MVTRQRLLFWRQHSFQGIQLVQQPSSINDFKAWGSQQMAGAADAILGHNSAHSLATGPWIAEPFISPLSFTITPALSSKYTNTPSLRLHAFFCRITTAFSTFFLNSGLPFLHVARTMSPGAQLGILFKRPPIPLTAIMYKFLAPLLSAQFIRDATHRPRLILSLAFLPARPRFIVAY